MDNLYNEGICKRSVIIGAFYRHFKGKLYQVRDIAYHSETGEKMVVYQALYGDYKTYVRPFDMFVSEVDKNKYPNATQLYRFERVDIDEKINNVNTNNIDSCVLHKATAENINEQKKNKVDVMNSDSDEISNVDSGLIKFLDADDYQEKLNILTSMHYRLNDNIINAMAASMDIEVMDGSIDTRYQSLRNCILAHAKYECLRPR